MTQPVLHGPPELRVASGHGYITDADVIAAWHEMAAGGEADRIVDGVMASIADTLSAVGLTEAIPAGVDRAIICGALRTSVVAALRRKLIRRAVVARDRPELLAGKTRGQRIAYLITGEPDGAL